MFKTSTLVKTGCLIITCLFVVVCSSAKSTEGTRLDPTTEAPSDVVRKYVSITMSGKLDGLSFLTTELPSQGDHTNQVNSTQERSIVMPDERVGNQAILDWVREDFPRSINENRFVLKSISNEVVKNDRASVQISLTIQPNSGPVDWVFLLRKVNGKWKIYDITTPAGAT
jgi:hypothetical protein